MKAVWNNQILAESDTTVVVENNHYFPPDSLYTEFSEKTDTETTCPWKGVASYYNIVVEGNANPDAAWYYANPKDAAKEIKDHVAFWRGVEVVD